MVQALFSLHRQLEELKYLYRELQLPLSLAESTSLSCDGIVAALLDRVSMPELVQETVQHQVAGMNIYIYL